MMLSQTSGEDEKDISVNFMKASLSNTSWTIQGLNLFINDSNLASVQFFIRHKVICQICRREIDIVNSTFGHMKIRGGYNIQISDCTVDGATVMSNSTLLDVMGGTLNVSNSSFQHLGGSKAESSGLLRAVGCRIHMVGVNSSNNEAPGGLIQIQNGSELFLHNSTFINNGHASSISSVISMIFNSSLTISTSVFSGNTASNGSCLWLHHNVSVTINQSTFVNNTADYGGVIYQYYEYENAYAEYYIHKYNSVDHTQSDSSGEEEIQQSLYMHDSYFVYNKAAMNGAVVYLNADSINIFMRKCNFTENEAIHGGAIYIKNRNSSVIVQQCIFTSDSLSLIGTHSQLIDCEFFGYVPIQATLNFQHCTLFISNCTFNEMNLDSITAVSTKLNITDSKWYGEKGCCLLSDNSEITIVGSHFADALVVLYDKYLSNLTVINTTFVNQYKAFINNGVGSQRVEFVNCLFDATGGFYLIGQTLFKNCTISNFIKPFIIAFHDVVYRTVSDQLEIVDCVFKGNSISDEKSFISVRNVSFTMINCLFTGNDARNHKVLNTTDVTIKNVTFFNNSLGPNDPPGNVWDIIFNRPKYDKSLFIVNNTRIEINNCNFENNQLQLGSLMLVFGSEVRVMNSVISDNYNGKMISIHDTKTVEFLGSKFINNSGIKFLDISSSTFLLIVSCSFEKNSGVTFDIRNTYDVILQRSRIYNPDVQWGNALKDANSLRIFRCTFPTFTYFWDHTLRNGLKVVAL